MIEIDNLTKRFGGLRALNAINLQIPAGELLAVLGPNGAGKSTLLKAMVGLVIPDEGQIRLDGVDVAQEPALALSKTGFVPQRVAFPAHMTVEQVLSFFATLKGAPLERVSEALAEVDLEGVRRRLIRGLSGGTLQRLGLAQGILSKPPILILDEPTVGLDPFIAHQFVGLLRQLNQQGTTIILSSHMLGEVERLAHRIAILQDGRLAALGTMAELTTLSQLPMALFITPTEPERARQLLVERGMLPTISGRALKVDVRADESLAIIDLLREAGMGIESFYTSAPTLDDLFRWVVERSSR